MRKIAVAILTVCLMLLTCEMATRLFARVARDVSQRDPLIGRRFHPNLNEYIYNYEADAPVLLQTNQIGFRGANLTINKPPHVRRVAVLGDSFTASMALPEHQTFCSQLQRLLNEGREDRRQWEVLNFGMHGSGTGQELALYRNLVKDLDPDVVVVAFGNATDVRDNSRELTSNPIIQYDFGEDGRLVQIPQSHGRVRASNFLNRISHFYTWQKMKSNTIKKLIQAQAAVECGRHLVYARREPEAFTRAWKLTAAILKAFRDECHEQGSQFFVVALPSAYQVYPEYFRTLAPLDGDQVELDPTHPDNRLADICRELQIRFRTLTPAFIEQAPSGSHQLASEQLFIGGVSHFNARGSEVAATELASLLSTPQVASTGNVLR